MIDRANPAASTPLIVCVGDLIDEIAVRLDAPWRRGSDAAAQITRRRGGSAANVAVAAAHLADRGERVLVVDFDAHHGNGTQDIFLDDPRVMFVSLHQWPLYPGTGWFDEIGVGGGAGFTMNVPLVVIRGISPM